VPIEAPPTRVSPPPLPPFDQPDGGRVVDLTASDGEEEGAHGEQSELDEVPETSEEVRACVSGGASLAILPSQLPESSQLRGVIETSARRAVDSGMATLLDSLVNRQPVACDVCPSYGTERTGSQDEESGSGPSGGAIVNLARR
jgi:hypothetical protein